jgi:hypothetical protein
MTLPAAQRLPRGERSRNRTVALAHPGRVV